MFPPAIDTKIIGAGYYGMTGQFDKTEENFLDYEQNSVLTKGKIIEVFPERRDAIRLPFPCFQTDCKFNGGMSGGPVFRGDTGDVCGVICSSLDTGEEENYVSYASTIWPALAIKLHINDSGEEKEISLLEFTRFGTIKTVDPVERYIIEKSSDGTQQLKVLD